jgi:hypothetical protein
MPADQAAGLRRRSARQPLRCIHCFSDSRESATRLALALHQRGGTVLLVDASGRTLADSSPRSLFDWRQQLARGQLQTLPMPYGDGWHAPGIRADEPALSRVAHGYDAVVFDAGPGEDLVLMPGAAHAAVIEVVATLESMRHAYALLKSLFHAGAAPRVGLMGETAACEQVRAACAHFLDPQFAHAVCSVAHEDDAFAELAVRMVDEETSPSAR